MNCPVDNTSLQMTERQGVEIDYCPQCRGVWLDRGELDKIIERSEQVTPQTRQDHAERGYSQDSDHSRRYNEHDGKNPKKRRESFLGDLFDFGG